MTSIFKDALFSTLFAISVLAITKFAINVNLKALNTFDLLSYKINYTDLYFSSFYENDAIDENIVLVNIENANRLEIANLITRLNTCEPKVIGVDVSFKGIRDSFQDSTLIEAVKSSKNIVFPIFDNPYFYNLKQTKQDLYFGSNEFLADENGILKYAHFHKGENKKLFSEVIAEKYNGSKISGDFSKEINYLGNYDHFTHLSFSEGLALKASSQIKDKIVLLGYAGKSWDYSGYSEDRYFTPLDFTNNLLTRPQTSGVVIHANIIRNIIKDDFIKISPRYLDYLILSFLLYLLNLFYLKHFRRLSISFYLKCRLFQLFFTGFLAYGMFVLFHFLRMKFGLAEWILALIASFELSMIFVYSMNYFGNRFGIKSYIHKKLNP